MDNAQNKRFVADFMKTYGRLPSLYASQGYDAAMLMDSAVRGVKGKIEDKEALGKALKAANFKSVRGAFKFNNNHYPVQDYYARVIGTDTQGRVTNRTLGHDPDQPRRRLRGLLQDVMLARTARREFRHLAVYRGASGALLRLVLFKPGAR